MRTICFNHFRKIIFLSFLISHFSYNIFAQCNNYGNIDLTNLSESSGDYSIDLIFQNEKRAIEKFFNVKAKLLFSNSIDIVNAVAKPDGYKYGTDGSITFTKGMINALRDTDKIGCVLAHEYAHILQYKYGWKLKKEKEDELFADYISGVYLHYRIVILENEIDRTDLFINSLYTLEPFGDYHFDSPDHHGTPRERRNATRKGFRIASRCFNFYGQVNNYYPDIKEFYELGKEIIFMDYCYANSLFTGLEATVCSETLHSKVESVLIKEISVNYDVYKNNLIGLEIKVNFTANQLQNDNCTLSAYFFQESGKPLNDSNNNYGTTDGYVSTWREFTPDYTNSNYNEFVLFIPYNELHLIKSGVHNVKFYLQAFKKRKRLSLRSRYKHFTISY